MNEFFQSIGFLALLLGTLYWLFKRQQDKNAEQRDFEFFIKNSETAQSYLRNKPSGISDEMARKELKRMFADKNEVNKVIQKKESDRETTKKRITSYEGRLLEISIMRRYYWKVLEPIFSQRIKLINKEELINEIRISFQLQNEEANDLLEYFLKNEIIPCAPNKNSTTDVILDFESDEWNYKNGVDNVYHFKYIKTFEKWKESRHGLEFNNSGPL